jgi:sugar O-acyltransferase (sialic acid O-acetyltransferase NeuD family)
MRIGIIGYGVLGMQIRNFLSEEQGKDLNIILFDDFIKNEQDTQIYPFKDIFLEKFSDLEFYLGIGYKHLEVRHNLIKKLKSSGRKVNSLIHNTGYISPSARIGDGCILFPGVNIDQNVIIEDGCIFHNGVIISHNSFIGECCYFAPNTVLSGDVKVGKFCFLGTGCLVSNSVIIGDSLKAGIGTVITNNIIGPGLSVIGNPAKVLSIGLSIK